MKKCCGLMLLLLMATLFMASCMSKTNEDLSGNVEPSPPAGRFMERDITPEVPEGYRIWRTFSTDDTLECVAVSGNHYRFYSSTDQGETWIELDGSWQDRFSGQTVFLEAIAPDRSYWFYTWNMEGHEIWRISPDGMLDSFPMPDGGRRVQQLLPIQGGRVLIQYLSGFGLETESHTNVYDIQSQELCYSIPQDGAATYRSSQSQIYLHQTYFYEDSRIYLGAHDIETGVKIEKNTGLYNQGVIPAPLAADFSGYFYYINDDGLHRMVPGGAVSEILLDSSAYSFQQDGYFITDLHVQDDQTILIALGTANLSNPGLLLRYTFAADEPIGTTADRITPEGVTYYIRYSDGHNAFRGSLIRSGPEGTQVLTDNAFLIVFATEDVVVFRRQDGDFFTQTKHPLYCSTLHYYDLHTGEVIDIFTDTYHKWKEHSQEPYEGQVLGANLDKSFPGYDPHYTLSDSKLGFYVTRIDDGVVDRYEYDFSIGELTLLDSVAYS